MTCGTCDHFDAPNGDPAYPHWGTCRCPVAWETLPDWVTKTTYLSGQRTYESDRNVLSDEGKTCPAYLQRGQP